VLCEARQGWVERHLPHASNKFNDQRAATVTAITRIRQAAVPTRNGVRGHTPPTLETLLADRARVVQGYGPLYEDELAAVRALPVGTILAGDCEPRWLGRLRRWFRR
jgi:hypothetical protein